MDMKSLSELGITVETIKKSEQEFTKLYEQQKTEKTVKDNRFISEDLSIMKAKRLEEVLKNSSVLSKLLDKKDREAMQSLQIQLDVEQGSKSRRELSLEERQTLHNIKRGITRRKYSGTKKHKIANNPTNSLKDISPNKDRDKLELEGEKTNLEIINNFDLEAVNKIFKTVSEENQELLDKIKESRNKHRDIF